jgi:hypothetical protein
VTQAVRQASSARMGNAPRAAVVAMAVARMTRSAAKIRSATEGLSVPVMLPETFSDGHAKLLGVVTEGSPAVRDASHALIQTLTFAPTACVRGLYVVRKVRNAALAMARQGQTSQAARNP